MFLSCDAPSLFCCLPAAAGAARSSRAHSPCRNARVPAGLTSRKIGWTLATAPGVAHSNRDMVPFALRALFP
jgi:hypothetical protein